MRRTHEALKKNAWAKWNISSGFLLFCCYKIKISNAQWLKKSKRPFYDLRQFVSMENRVQRELIDGPSLP
ncbi:MAG: hypothetical protein VXY88_05780, partial [Bacteroidota bacterium]|nr:hypothetical protein [Bacteroidota bacterium]